MGHVEIRTRLAGSILLAVALTILATEIINIMKEHSSRYKNVTKSSQKRHKKSYTIGITRPSLRRAGPNFAISLIKR